MDTSEIVYQILTNNARTVFLVLATYQGGVGGWGGGGQQCLRRNRTASFSPLRPDTYLVMIRGMMIRTALTRNGNPGKPKLDDRIYIGLKIKAPRKLQKVSTVVTEENMAPTEQEK